MYMKKETIRNTTIFLDGGTFENCDFDKCKIIYSGYLPVHLAGCRFGPSVIWSFDGPTSNTIMFMKALYAQGAGQLLENTFEQIRGKPPKSGATLH